MNYLWLYVPGSGHNLDLDMSPVTKPCSQEPPTLCSSCVPGPPAPAGHKGLGAYVELKVFLRSS